MSDPPAGSFERRRVRRRVHAALFGDAEPLRLGRFIIEERVGAGSMGIVYRARDPELRRDVAVKVVSPHLAAASAPQVLRRRIQREATALARISHPSVVAVHEVGECEGELFIVMEWVAGEDARDWAAAPGRRLEAVTALAREAGRGLSAAHARGVVHRDFKPENLRVGAGDRPRILDFGLARIQSGFGDTPPGATTAPGGRAPGTPRYMAPELQAGAKADARSDQYAFCVTLQELIDTAGQRRPRALRALLQRGLSAAPTERYADMDALLVELSTIEDALRRRGWNWARLAVVAGAGLLLGWLLAHAL